jgi:ketosteroid isomerase-like protein
MKHFITLLLATSLMMVVPVAHSQMLSVDTKADIQKMASACMDAYNEDAATIAKMYAEDAVFSGPGWTASGHTAIEDSLTKELAAGVFSRLNSITVDQDHRVADLDYSASSWRWGS